MPLNSLIIANKNGNMILTKYFSIQNAAANMLFEQQLMANTVQYWQKIYKSPETISIGHVHVLFQRVDDLVLFMGGYGDIDEPVCKTNILIQSFFAAIVLTCHL